MAEQWYDNYGKVDAFNHTMVGDGGQGWESALELREKRNFPLFTGLLSLIDTNIFIAMKHFYDYQGTHIDFRRELTNVLLNNPLRIDADDVSYQPPENRTDHKRAYAGNNKRSKCVVCSRVNGVKGNDIPLSDLYCLKCGPEKMCRDSSKRNCWEWHVQNNGLPPRTRKTSQLDD